jgi:hypothetical protein
VSEQASAHLTVRDRPAAPRVPVSSPVPAPAPGSKPAPREARAPTEASPRRPPPASPWHVNAGVVIGEGLAVLGGGAMLLVDGNRALHRNLEGVAHTPAKWGWAVIGAVVCAVLLRTLVGVIARRSPIGVIGSLIASVVVLAVSADLVAFILADPSFKARHGYGAVVALGAGVIGALGGFIAVLGGLAATAEGLRRSRVRAWG